MNKKINVKYTYDEICNKLASYPVTSKESFFISFVLLGIGLVDVNLFTDNDFVVKCGYIIIALACISIALDIYCMPSTRLKLYLNKAKETNKAFINGVDYTYELNDEDFNVTSIVDGKTENKTIKYSDVDSLSISNDTIYFIIKKKNMYILPRNEFNEEEYNNLIKIFKANKKKVVIG